MREFGMAAIFVAGATFLYIAAGYIGYSVCSGG